MTRTGSSFGSQSPEVIGACKMRLISEDPAFTRHEDEDGLTFFAGEKFNWSGTRCSGRAKIYVCDSEDAVVRVLRKHVRNLKFAN